MTETILNRIFSGSATSDEFLRRIRYAAALGHLSKLPESELAALLTIERDTLAEWKRRPEWRETVQAISMKMVFTSPTLRLFIQEMAQYGSPGMQQEVVETAVDMAGNIQWTTDLGNAFLAQQTDVMDAVQRMSRQILMLPRQRKFSVLTAKISSVPTIR